MSLLRDVLIKASQSKALEHQIRSHAITRNVVMRYVAGTTLEEGLAVCRRLVAEGKTVTLDYLGESVSTEDEARAAAKAYVEIVAQLAAESLPAGVSVKPSQMGLKMSAELCEQLLGDIAAAGERDAEHVTLDMEGSDVTEDTVRLVERLQAAGHAYVGCAVQSYLHRTAVDVVRLSAVGASLRLCKGAYAEPLPIAFQSRNQVDASYARSAEYLLRSGHYPRFATHDDRLIRAIQKVARLLGREPHTFEFQMLHGVRPTLQDELVAAGYRLRIYVPFGEQWYPYFMRRLAERPANLVFFLRSLRDT